MYNEFHALLKTPIDLKFSGATGKMMRVLSVQGMMARVLAAGLLLCGSAITVNAEQVSLVTKPLSGAPSANAGTEAKPLFSEIPRPNLPVSERYLIEAWQSDEGLPQGSVISLAQTRDGYIWVGTFGGVARFDGVRFQVFNKDNTPELPGNAITGLFEAHDGALLVCTAAGGIAAVRKGKFELLLKEQKEGDDIVAAAKDQLGGTILSSLSGLLWRWNAGKLTVLSSAREPGLLRFGPIHPGVLCEDSSGGFWTLGHQGRLLHLVANKWETASAEGEPAGEECNALVRDAKSQLWLGTDRGLYVLRNGRWEPMAASGIQDPAKVVDGFAGRDGEIWFSSKHGEHGGFWMLKEGRRTVSAEDFASNEADIYPLGEDAHGGLCLGSFANGFYRISPEGETTHLDRQTGLPGNSVRTYLLDREGNEWLGLDDGGLVRLRPRRASSFASTPEAQVATYSVCEDHEGTIWVGTSSEGLFRGKQGALMPFETGVGHGLGSILSVFEDRSNRLWVGTYGDGLFLREGNQFVQAFNPALVGKRVRAIYEDSRGRLWLGCRAGLAYFENGQVTLVSGPEDLGELEVQCLAEDSQNRLWAGTRGKGLLCLKNGQWSSFRASDGLANDNVLSLHPNAAGALWIGTAGGGLSLLRGGIFANVTSKRGLPSDTICHIAEDNKGTLWFSSPHGVFSAPAHDLEVSARGAQRTVRWTTCGVADGMPTRECTGGSQPSGWSTRDGRLLIPTIKGLAVVQFGTAQFNNVPPTVLIEEVRIDSVRSEHTYQYQEQWSNLAPFSTPHPLSSLVIPPGKSRLDIRYTALSFSAPEKVRFKVRLEPLEKEWVDVENHREVDYSFLRPGNYVFRVIACNSDGVWNGTGAVLAFALMPHFWQTSAFTVLWAAGLTGGIAGAVGYLARRRHRKRMAKIEELRAVENERARIARDIHDDLGSSLTEIGLLCALAVRESTPAPTARSQVLRIMERSSELARTLDETVWALNPKNDLLGRLATYLCQFAKEFLEPTGIRCRLDLGDLPEVPVTAETRHNIFLVLKEALNNAVKHSCATEIWLRMAEQGPLFVLEIADNGAGFDAGKKSEPGNGLRNMARRMEAIGGLFALRSSPASGTTICLKLPLPRSSPVSGSLTRVLTTQLGDARRNPKR